MKEIKFFLLDIWNRMLREPAKYHKKWYPDMPPEQDVYVPVVHMSGFLEDGTRVLLLDSGTRPFMLAERVAKPKKGSGARKKFNKRFLRKPRLPRSLFTRENAPLKVELVERSFKAEISSWYKIYGVNPSVDIRDWRYFLQNEGLEVAECDIYFDQVYMKTRGIAPSAWNTISGAIVEEPLFYGGATVGEPLSSGGATVGIDGYSVFRIKSFDGIEVDEERHYPDVVNGVFDIEGERPILTIFYGVEYGGKVKAFKLCNRSKDYDGEKKLLKRFKKAYHKYPCDVLHQYNGFNYDWDVILGACEDHNIHLEFGIDGSDPRETQYNTYQIRGRPTVDAYGFAKTVGSKRKFLYAVHKHMHLEKKVKRREYYEVDRSKIYELEWEDVERHCMSDIRCCYDIGKYSLDYLFYLSRITGVPVDQCGYVSMNVNLEGLLMRFAHKRNELVPTRGQFEDEIRAASLKGATVFDVEEWFAKYVVVFDFAAMYPNIMADYNISYETYVAAPQEHVEYLEVPDTDNRRVYRFRKDIIGFFTETVRYIIAKINEAKKRFKDISTAKYGGAVQAIKTMGRSLYGYLKYVGARWGNPWAARAVTAEGRNRVRNAAAFAKRKYSDVMKIIYGDTDSIFAKMKKRFFTHEFCTKFSEEASADIGAELAIDKFYDKIFFCMHKSGTRLAKKKYIYLDDKGDVGFTGFAVARGDWSPVATMCQKRVAEFILKSRSTIRGVRKAIRYTNFLMRNIDKLSLDKFIIAVRVRPLEDYDESYMHPHVCVARRNPAEFIADDGRVEYVIAKPSKGREIWGRDYRGILSCRAISPKELSRKSELDLEYYRYKQIAKLSDEVVGQFIEFYDLDEELDWDIPETAHYTL